MDFGQALQAVKAGKKIARLGWNGKGMFAVYQKGYPQGIPCNKQTAEAWGMQEGDLFRCEPYLQLRMANGSHAMWNPNTLDILAEDWIIVGDDLVKGDLVCYTSPDRLRYKARVTQVWTQDCVNLEHVERDMISEPIPTSVPRYQEGMMGFYFEHIDEYAYKGKK